MHISSYEDDNDPNQGTFENFKNKNQKTMTRYRLHFGDSALVLSHDFQTMISDFVNPFETYRDVDAPLRPVGEQVPAA